MTTYETNESFTGNGKPGPSQLPLHSSALLPSVAAPQVRIARDGAVGTITIDRRERFNALDLEGATALYQAGLWYAQDPTIRVIVLRGTGAVFCSGADLKYIRAQVEAGKQSYGTGFRQVVGYFHDLIRTFHRAPKPVIAAVDGMVAAGGIGIALGCDLVIASARSTFEYAYFKTALTGAEGTTFFLPRLVGLQRAMSLALLNQRLSAQQAWQMGLIGAVYADEKFDEAVAHTARQLAAGPTASYATAKRLMREAIEEARFSDHLAHELDALSRAADGQDVKEGIAAFFAKRSPQFLGKE